MYYSLLECQSSSSHAHLTISNLGNSVIKGTSAYRGASQGHQDIDTGTLLQMIGRAGRPGFDTSGTAVIMTDTLSKTRFENMSQG